MEKSQKIDNPELEMSEDTSQLIKELNKYPYYVEAGLMVDGSIVVIFTPI